MQASKFVCHSKAQVSVVLHAHTRVRLSTRCICHCPSAVQSRCLNLSADETAGPLCTLLLLATKDSFTRASSLCSPAAASSILSPLLLYICSSQEPTAAACTLGLLIHHVIFQQGLLQAAMTALAIQQYSETRHSGDRMRQPPSRQQIVLLQLLADELESPAGNR